MKIGAIDRFTNQMVYFDSMEELVAFRAKQASEAGNSSKVKLLGGIKPRRFIFSMTVEASDEIEATLACESIIAKRYESDVVNFMLVFDVKEVVKESV